MTRLPVLSAREIIKALCKTGFKEAPKRGKGSHEAFVKISDTGTLLVIIPQGKNVPKGTLLAILEQAGISKEDFLRLL